ncbi:DUF2237 family protein [Parvularcula lutaonensis]|uniref:DUF2237 family protein n=1 Tax=Parvularcula lutaonensis TaxID=491923 RepID=A0ABV7M9S1_9PROT|nr:DUF2237 domain-containing protein [Parvularcula lutaonensis]GGY44010.1 hypothetical protein GCM10007148_11100 [Parvularcula lutaonensis]
MAKNVLGGELQVCGCNPMTGFTRTGFCETGRQDRGSHTVCAVVDEAFLSFTRQKGNDLSTPRPEWGFPGLKPGDRWCVCAGRWEEARQAGRAPGVVLAACHERALDRVALSDLKAHAVDRPQ